VAGLIHFQFNADQAAAPGGLIKGMLLDDHQIPPQSLSLAGVIHPCARNDRTGRAAYFQKTEWEIFEDFEMPEIFMNFFLDFLNLVW
jgi:hypothetical protein